MKKIILFITICLSLLLLACQNKNQAGNSMTDSTMSPQSKVSQDRDFLNEAAQGGMTEVQLGKLAQQKASSKEVKDFGMMMVDDHSKANNELMDLANENDVNVTDTLSEDNQDKINDLAKLSGKNFDKKYVEMMVDDHKEDVDTFKDESQDASSPQVRAWAAKTLPTLQKHLDKIQNIQKKMNL